MSLNSVLPVTKIIRLWTNLVKVSEEYLTDFAATNSVDAMSAYYSGFEVSSITANIFEAKITKFPSENLKLRRSYQEYLRLASGKNVSTIHAELRYLQKFEEFCTYKAYFKVCIQDIYRFKTALEESLTTDVLHDRRSASTLVHTLLGLQSFFIWLEEQPSIALSTVDLGQYFKRSCCMMALLYYGVATPLLLTVIALLRHLVLYSAIERAIEIMPNR